MDSVKQKNQRITDSAYPLNLSTAIGAWRWARMSTSKCREAMRIFMYEKLASNVIDVKDFDSRLIKLINRFIFVFAASHLRITAMRTERRSWYEFDVYLTSALLDKESTPYKVVKGEITKVSRVHGDMFYNEFVTYFTEGSGANLPTPSIDRESKSKGIAYYFRD